MKIRPFNQDQRIKTLPERRVVDLDISTEEAPWAMKNRELSSPILVTGAHRSGTTWVGKILASGPRMAYINEPFNYGWRRPGVCGAKWDYWYTYVCEENGGKYFEYIKDTLRFRYGLLAQIRQTRSLRGVGHMARECSRFVLARARQLRAVMKDPIALMSSEWLERHFGMQIVVMIRHPAAFAYSLKRRGWRFDFRELLDQELLMRDMLEPFRDRMIHACRSNTELMTEAGLLWSILYHVVSDFRKIHPHWIFIRHEDIATNPRDEFEKLFDKLGLTIEVETEKTIDLFTRSSGKQRPDGAVAWLERDSRTVATDWVGKLSVNELSKLRDEVESVYSEFYDDAAWRSTL